MNLATAASAAGVCNDGGTGNKRRHRRRRHMRPFSSLCAVLLATAVAGCARNTPERDVSPAATDVKAAPVRSAAPPRRPPPQIRYVQPRIRKPDAALLTPMPAPDCEFRRPDLRTVDPKAWAQLKAEYELQCYQDAERAARNRLSLLQEASKCEIEPASQNAPLRQQKFPAR